MAKRKDFCKRGHNLHETRKVTGRSARCTLCNKITKRAWEKANKARVVERRREYRKTFTDQKREKIRAVQQLWRDKNREKIRNRERAFDLKRKYGIDMEDYNRFLLKQKGVCGICRKLPKKKRLAVDHCHTTGVIRGLLCNNCNIAIGLISDSPSFALSLYKYLYNFSQLRLVQ